MKKVGNYLLVSQLGKGQFGTVYRAKHIETDEAFAVKAIEKEKVNATPKHRKLFDTEMDVMSKLNHPNILHLFESLETPNNYYLIINYCNGGDLEEHVKNNQFLGEDESIYFLMQIMNGFKELHKHKIMHRDFKLANIFLHDDNIIIGDFGFAKSGVEMTTTILGSPITMAPELLNAQSSSSRYTNKADLWSIGVCFFHMIFGKPPWEFKTMIELQTKVESQSGSNLSIPNEPKTSQSCKQLLRSLLTPDPNKRIEWKDFFNHPLFQNYASQKQLQAQPEYEMKQSVMFRNNQNKVQEMFNQNKMRNDNKEVELVEPENLHIDEQEAKKDAPPPALPQQVNLERAINLVKSRLIHEKKTILFMIHTCKKLRDLSKKKAEIGTACPSFMYSAVLLMRKGIYINDLCVHALRSRNNIFNMQGWAEFLNSPYYRTMSAELEKDCGIYDNLQKYLQQKLREEQNMNDPNVASVIKFSTSPSIEINDLFKELKKHTGWLLEFFKSTRDLPADVHEELMVGLVHLFVSTHSETEFPFQSAEGLVFDWPFYERNMNMNYAQEIIDKAFQMYGMAH